MKLNDATAISGNQVANLFATHFNSVYSCNTTPVKPDNIYFDKVLDPFTFSRGDVVNELNALKCTLGCGPDGIGIILRN